MLLAGCNHTEDNIKGNSIFIDDETVNTKINIYEFSFINRAPVATDKHDLDEVIKFILVQIRL